MSWEPVEEWPDGQSGGVFRGAAEPVLATRGAPTAFDRVKLWWNSTPDVPVSALPARVALTPGWLFVETRDGARRRAPHDSLIGVRREAGRVIYAVSQGDDLVLVERRDRLEAALDAKVAGGAPVWRAGSKKSTAAVVVVAALALAPSLQYAIFNRETALRHIQMGLTTSEVALGFYAGMAGVFVTFLFVLFFPQRLLVDSIGVTSIRGIFRAMRSTKPAELVKEVHVRRFVTTSKKGGTRFVLHYVEIHYVEPHVKQRIYAGSSTVETPQDAAEAARASEIGKTVAAIFDVEVREST